MEYVPPDNFSIVSPGLYRSKAFAPINFPFIQRLELKTILLLSSEEIPKVLETFFIQNRIEVKQIYFNGENKYSWRPISDEMVKEGLEIVLKKCNSSNPILIMDSSGFHETGVLVGCLRKLQGWNFNSIVVEYRSFAGVKARFIEELFIELFDLDLVNCYHKD